MQRLKEQLRLLDPASPPGMYGAHHQIDLLVISNVQYPRALINVCSKLFSDRALKNRLKAWGFIKNRKNKKQSMNLATDKKERTVPGIAHDTHTSKSSTRTSYKDACILLSQPDYLYTSSTHGGPQAVTVTSLVTTTASNPWALVPTDIATACSGFSETKRLEHETYGGLELDWRDFLFSFCWSSA